MEAVAFVSVDPEKKAILQLPGKNQGRRGAVAQACDYNRCNWEFDRLSR